MGGGGESSSTNKRDDVKTEAESDCWQPKEWIFPSSPRVSHGSSDTLISAFYSWLWVAAFRLWESTLLFAVGPKFVAVFTVVAENECIIPNTFVKCVKKKTYVDDGCERPKKSGFMYRDYLSLSYPANVPGSWEEFLLLSFSCWGGHSQSTPCTTCWWPFPASTGGMHSYRSLVILVVQSWSCLQVVNPAPILSQEAGQSFPQTSTPQL